jgi:hypothetical protein
MTSISSRGAVVNRARANADVLARWRDGSRRFSPDLGSPYTRSKVASLSPPGPRDALTPLPPVTVTRCDEPPLVTWGPPFGPSLDATWRRQVLSPFVYLAGRGG